MRRGYDAVSLRYEEAYGGADKYADWLGELGRCLPRGGTVLDLGCGSGLPVARTLTAGGFRVTGVDISDVQIRRARQQVPDAAFVRADITDPAFVPGGPGAFDAVVSFYALIHLPLDEQPRLLGRIGGWLRPGGWFVGTTGHRAWTGVEEDWLGGGAPPCGGATPTRPPTAAGSPRPA